MRRRPESLATCRRLITATLILLAMKAGSLEASILLAGSTGSGMKFHGRIAHATRSMVFLEDTHSGSQHQIGVPLEDVADLRILLDDSPSVLVELESCCGLLPYLTEASKRSLMERIMPLSKRHSWQLAYTWADRFLNSGGSGEFLLEAKLEKCHAMFRLGQFNQLESDLDEVNNMVSPITAPALLCWLNARISLRKGLPQEARFWAKLPFLQIPCYNGPLGESLRQLADQAEHGQTMNSKYSDR